MYLAVVMSIPHEKQYSSKSLSEMLNLIEKINLTKKLKQKEGRVFEK